MKSVEEIAHIAKSRQDACGSGQARMDEIRRLYNGEIEVNLPELQENEKAVAANLAQLGIDQMAMRAASVVPAVKFAVERTGKAADDRARDKRDVIHHWWDRSRLTTHVIPRRARWFFAFAVAPVTLRPDSDGLPRWYDRHPIGTYPAPVSQIGDLCPPDVVFTFKKSGPELMRDYPDQMWRLCGNDKARLQPQYDVLEYVDAEQITCLVVGKPSSPYEQGTPHEVLHSVPNRTGRPLSVLPGRITLDRPLGQFDGLIGAYQLQARLMALYTIAQERAIFPETWIVSQPGFPRAEVIVPADPKEGQVGEIQGGSIQKVDMSPSPLGANLIDRLEYIERASGAIPAEFSGHSTSTIRTGRRGDAVMSAAVDHRLQEAQSIFEASLEEENRIAIAIAKTYSSKTFSFHTPRGKVTYSADLFDGDDQHEVRYAYAGADANSLNIAVGQKLGMETLSRETAMALDPMIKDVESELDRIRAESLERAFWSSVQAQAADPNGPYQPRDLARLGQLIASDKADPYEAVQMLDEEIRQRQEAQAAGQAQGAEMMPGLGMPGAPGSPVPPNIADVGPSIGNLSQMLTQLRRPQMALDSERQPLAAPAAA